jgi:hypothetical protein
MLYRVHLELIETLRNSGDKQKKNTNFYESLIKYRFRQELDNTAFQQEIRKSVTISILLN